MKLGQAIRRLMDDRGWTLDELAHRAGMTKGNLSRIVNDKQWPSKPSLMAIAASLNVRVYQIIALAEDVDIPEPARENQEREMLSALKAMSQDMRDHYVAIARGITRTQPEDIK